MRLSIVQPIGRWLEREDFMKEFAQTSMRKRKANEIDNMQDVDKIFGIVTDGMYI